MGGLVESGQLFGAHRRAFGRHHRALIPSKRPTDLVEVVDFGAAAFGFDEFFFRRVVPFRLIAFRPLITRLVIWLLSIPKVLVPLGQGEITAHNLASPFFPRLRINLPQHQTGRCKT